MPDDLTFAEDLYLIKPPQRLLGTHLVAGGLNIIFGQPETYKSFYALSAALHLSAQGIPVVYSAGEGASGLDRRVRAWKANFNSPDTHNLAFNLEDLNLRDPVSVVRFIERVKRAFTEAPPSLLVVDTLALSIPGGDENSSKDIGSALEVLRNIQRSFRGCTICLVHHTTKTGATERGSSALRGAADCMIEMSRKGSLVRVSCSKLKDWDKWDPEYYTLKEVSDSAILIPVDHKVHRETKLAPSQRQVLEMLAEPLFIDFGANPLQLKDATDLAPSTVYNCLNELRRRGLIDQDEDRGSPYKINAAGLVLLSSISRSFFDTSCNTLTVENENVELGVEFDVQQNQQVNQISENRQVEI